MVEGRERENKQFFFFFSVTRYSCNLPNHQAASRPSPPSPHKNLRDSDCVAAAAASIEQTSGLRRRIPTKKWGGEKKRPIVVCRIIRYDPTTDIGFPPILSFFIKSATCVRPIPSFVASQGIFSSYACGLCRWIMMSGLQWCVANARCNCP